METLFGLALRKRFPDKIGKARHGWVGLESLEGRSLLSTVSIGSLLLDHPVVNNAGSELTITAGNITDSDAGARIRRVKFYADVNSDSNPAGGDPQTGDDIYLGSARIDPDGNAILTIDNTRPRKFPLGDYKITAVVADNTGGTGFADADITVNATPPTVAAVALLSHHGTIVTGATDNTLAAWVLDPGNVVQNVDFFVNQTPSGVVDSSSEAITGTLVQHGRTWVLRSAAMPGDLTPGSTVEIIAQATDVNGQTYTQTLEDVSVVAPAAPTVTQVFLLSHHGTIVPGTTDNLLAALVSDPDHTVQTVDFFVNQTPSGVVDSSSEAITGTLVHHGRVWQLKDAAMPGDLTPGSTVEIVARATDVNGQTYTQTLGDVQVVAVTPPSVTSVSVPSHQGTLVIGGAHNALAALVNDPDHTVQTVDFFVNQTPTGVVDSGSEAVTGTLVHFGKTWVLRDATLPSDLAPGSTVEIIAQATDNNGQTYTQTLEDVSVVAVTPPSITAVELLNRQSAIIAGSSHNSLIALVTDPDRIIQTVDFFVNQTPSGVVDSGSEAITGTLVRLGNAWLLRDATAPADLTAGASVEVIAQATDVNGQTYTLTLENISVIAAPTPVGGGDHGGPGHHPGIV